MFDLNFLTEKCFDAGFMILDSFTIKPCVKIRNVFSLPMSTRQGLSVNCLGIPKALVLSGVIYDTKYFDESIEYALITPRLRTGEALWWRR